MNHNIILGHGSRNPEANKVLRSISDMFESETKESASYAYLQFEEPDLETVIDKIYSSNISTITVIPLFLYPGIHIKKDVPEKIIKIKEKYPNLTIRLADPIGADSTLIAILKERADNATEELKS
ncbi:sirohydrochlorin chelatase [Natranaerobius trueperi]|uniref:Cobalamin biosynthesis protein CbiX n=1 Tax=Natranaerobius trueperi TaxID=759412 RepID=A0A226BXW8_9FIRM|nr:CbiX/SirB N-terminal domain-containing protein [Natranaerobius trueperi]OWZ82980.1 cobalamin biosynthesis protein CbiX [Natranaerobius trueperi]